MFVSVTIPDTLLQLVNLSILIDVSKSSVSTVIVLFVSAFRLVALELLKNALPSMYISYFPLDIFSNLYVPSSSVLVLATSISFFAITTLASSKGLPVLLNTVP